MPIEADRSIPVIKSKSQVYRYGCRFTTFSDFLKNVDSVVALDEKGRCPHRAVKARLGMKVEWDSGIIEDIADERISWRSVKGSEIDNRGAVSRGNRI